MSLGLCPSECLREQGLDWDAVPLLRVLPGSLPLKPLGLAFPSTYLLCFSPHRARQNRQGPLA